MDIPIGESLMATLGVEGYLKREPPPLTLSVVERAEGLPRRLDRVAKQYLAGYGFAEQAHTPPEAPAYKSILEWLHDPQELSAHVRVMAAFRDNSGVADAYKRTADAAVAYLQNHLAKRARQTMTESVAIVPSRQELAEFARRWEAVNTPEIAIGRLLAGTLSSAGADALRAVYPGVYACLLDYLTRALIARRERSAMYSIPPRKDAQLQLLTGSRLGSEALGQLLQTAQAGAKPGPKPSVQKSSKSVEAMQTPTDRLESR